MSAALDPSCRVGATEDEIDETVAARLARQKILEREHPPELWVILDEGVLRRPVGGPEVMQGQLVHLPSMARRPHIVVQVVPLAAGAHQGPRLAFGACVWQAFAAKIKGERLLASPFSKTLARWCRSG